MRLLLCTLNARYTHLSPALRYLRNELRLAAPAADIQLREYVITQSLVEIVRDICAVRPDVLLCSVYIWNSRHFRSILPDIRALLPNCRLIVGGPEVSWDPRPWLTAVPETDLVVCGPGESAVRELALAGFDLSAWPERVLVAAVPDFAAIPQPYDATDFPSFATRYVYYESTRGCPFDCTYCLSSNTAHSLQPKALVQVFAELKTILAARPALVKFVDRTFNAEPERARLIWAFLLDAYASHGTRFHFEVHPALLQDADFGLLEQLPFGLFQFEIGVQSVHQATRTEIRRGGNWPAEKAAIARLIDRGTVHVHADLIAGLPGEDLSAFAESFNELVGLGADHVQLGFLKVLPGTFMHERRSGYGLIAQKDAPYEILQNRWLANTDLIRLKQLEELLENIGNTHRYDQLLRRAYAEYGSPFAAFSALVAYCDRVGFDIRTRNREKVQPMLESWMASRGQN